MLPLFFIISSGDAEQFLSAIQELFCTRKPIYPGSAYAVSTEANTLSQAHRLSLTRNSLRVAPQSFQKPVPHKYLTSQYFSAWIRIAPHTEILATSVESNISNTGDSNLSRLLLDTVRLRWGPSSGKGRDTTVGIDFTL